jgi:UDP-2-acetamido-3-amino-2,3-dideoxy-glucuronate N-acetyltransferase
MSAITTHKDYNENRGYLLPLNFSELDFEPKRMFVVNNVPIREVRGNHAHYTTRQLVICTNGHVTVRLDTGKKKTTAFLSKGQSIIVPKLVWDSQKFLTPDAEIVVLCSTEYDATDYILDYTTFLLELEK